MDARGGDMDLMMAVRFVDRARGLEGDGPPALPEGGAICIAPCSSIHTFMMRRSIDYAFARPDGRVMRAERGLPPNRVRFCPGAAFVLERFAGEGPWPEVGEPLRLSMSVASDDGRGGPR